MERRLEYSKAGWKEEKGDTWRKEGAREISYERTKKKEDKEGRTERRTQVEIKAAERNVQFKL